MVEESLVGMEVTAEEAIVVGGNSKEMMVGSGSCGAEVMEMTALVG